MDHISVNAKYSWFSEKFNKLFEKKVLQYEDYRNKKFKHGDQEKYLIDHISVIVKYFGEKDKDIFMQMMNYKLKIGAIQLGAKNEYKGRILDWICECRYVDSVNVIINLETLTDEEKYKLFTEKEDRYSDQSAIHRMSGVNIVNVLKYFESKQMNIRVLFGESISLFIQKASLSWDRDYGCPLLLSVFKYFNDKHDKKFMMELLNKDSFKCLIYQKDILDYVFNESILTDKDRLNVLNALNWKIVLERDKNKTVSFIGKGTPSIIKYLENVILER